MVTGVPTGGRLGSGTSTVAGCPAVVLGTTFLAVIGEPAPDTGIVTLTLPSSFSPWFWNLTVKVGGDAAGMRLTEPGCSVVGPTLTAVRPCPCVPGAAVPLELDPPPWAPRRSATVFGSSH